VHAANRYNRSGIREAQSQRTDGLLGERKPLDAKLGLRGGSGREIKLFPLKSSTLLIVLGARFSACITPFTLSSHFLQVVLRNPKGIHRRKVEPEAETCIRVLCETAMATITHRKRGLRERKKIVGWEWTERVVKLAFCRTSEGFGGLRGRSGRAERGRCGGGAL
jgi:hypothetical protein